MFSDSDQNNNTFPKLGNFETITDNVSVLLLGGDDVPQNGEGSNDQCKNIICNGGVNTGCTNTDCTTPIYNTDCSNTTCS